MKKLKTFNLIPPTLLIAIATLLSRLLGIVRDHLLAKTFGATAGTGIFDLDVYYAAFRVPDLIYTLLVLGAVSAAFIPIFTQHKKEGDLKQAWAFASSMFHLLFLAVLVLSLFIYVLAPYLAPLIAGGFNAEQLELTVHLMRILLWSPIIFSATAVLVALQDSFKTFFLRSIGPLFYNLGIILGIIYFAPQFGVGGVATGVIIGAVLQLIVQIPALKLIGFKYQFGLGHKRADVRQAFKLILPRILGLSLSQLTLIVNTFMASFLMTGSITIFYLADNLQGLPLGMIGIAFAITSFATLSELASEPSKKPFADEIGRVMSQVLFLVIPATVGIWLLRYEIIDVILVTGKFTTSDALLTAKVLGFLILSLFAQSLIPTLARGFYAFHNTKTPLWTAFVGSAISIGGSLLLAFPLKMGIAGIALAFTMGNVVNFLLLFVLMNRHLKQTILSGAHILKMLMASSLMGLIVYLAKSQVVFEGFVVYRLSLLGLYALIGALVYFVLSWAFRLPQLKGLRLK